MLSADILKNCAPNFSYSWEYECRTQRTWVLTITSKVGFQTMLFYIKKCTGLIYQLLSDN